MNISNQTYKELSIPYFKEAFDIIDDVMINYNIPYYLIGASAIALEFLKKDIKPSRGTKDIDFAIMISSMNQYDGVVSSLLEKGFIQIKDTPHRVYNEQYNLAIDILPFGEIEQQFTVKFNDRKTELHVLGFSEVLKKPASVRIEDKTVFIPPLPGMIVLKLVAWSDRPDKRENDLTDILRIIEHYFDLEFDEIVEFHNDIFPKEGLDPLLISAEVLGRKIKIYLDNSEELSSRIHKVISDNLKKPEDSKIAKEWASQKDSNIDYTFSILKAFYNGFISETKS